MILILLLEPDVRERRRLSWALTLEGYSVRTAQDSREAVRLFLAQPVDLLLVSRGEPELDGRIAFELLAAIKPSLPVIVMKPPPARRTWDQRLNLHIVIEKPDDLDVLFGVLRLLLQLPCSRHDARIERSTRIEDGCPSPPSRDAARESGPGPDHPGDEHIESSKTKALSSL